MGNLVLTCNGPYRIPNVRTEVLGVYTNNIPGGAFRGFGAPQGNFIAESQMNKLAEALEMDPSNSGCATSCTRATRCRGVNRCPTARRAWRIP